MRSYSTSSRNDAMEPFRNRRITVTAVISGIRQFADNGYFRATIKNAATVENDMRVSLGEHHSITNRDNATMMGGWDAWVNQCPKGHMVQVTFSATIGFYPKGSRFANGRGISVEYIRCSDYPRVYADVQYSRRRLAKENRDHPYRGDWRW